MSRLPLIPLGSYLLPQTRSALGHIRTSAAPASSSFFSTSSPSPLLHRHLYSPAPPPFYPWYPPPIYLPPPPLTPAHFLHPAPFLGASFRPISSTNGLRMERPETEREPPQKRRKSSEERLKGEHGTSETTERRTNCQYQDRSRDLRENSKSGKRFSRESSREKDVEGTEKSADGKSRQRTLPKEDSSRKSRWDKGPTEKKMERQDEGSVGAERSKTTAVSNDAQAESSETLHRHWELSPLSRSDVFLPPGVTAGFDFTVMSYNILSQDLLLDNAYLYRHCDPQVLQWEYRLPRILQEIQALAADVLCLQEVQEDHFVRQIRPALEKLGYQCEYKKRTGYKSDGCAVAFKKSRLSLLSSNPVEFYRRGDALLDRDNVGLVVRLSPSSDPASSFCVANTHLLYNPRRGDIKLAQLAILLAEVNRMSRLPDGSTNPVLLCGDLNSTPWSPLYSFLTTGRLDYRGMAIGTVSGQERYSKAQRLLCCPLWSNALGIDSSCQYQDPNRGSKRDSKQDRTQERTEEPACSSPSAVEGAISDLTVEDQTPAPTQDTSQRWRVSHSLKLQSSYDHRLSPDGREEITTCHSRTAMTVDYILYTPDSPGGPSPSTSSLPGGRGLQLLGRLSLVGQSELEQVNRLPNQSHSSDHLPLLARFRLRLR